MTIKEMYRGCVKKNNLGILICCCFIFLLVFAIGTIDDGDANINLSKYAVLPACVILLIAMIIQRIKNSRDFRFYKMMYNFNEIEAQMAEKETISVPKNGLFFTRDYVIAGKYRLNIWKRNAIMKVEEEKHWSSGGGYTYIFVVYPAQEKKVNIATVHVKEKGISEELEEIRNALRKAFP